MTAVCQVEKCDRSFIAHLLPAVARDIHKGCRGGVLVFGGSWNYRGAPLLASLGALRAGAGLVVLAIPEFMADGVSMTLPEAIIIPLKTNCNDEIDAGHFEAAVSPWIKRCDAAVYGPGIGRSPSLAHVTRWFWEDWRKPLLMDADALFFLSELRGGLPYREDAVITPHVGEAAGLLGISPEEVNGDRLAAAARLADIAGTAVLKGKDSVISTRNKARIACEGSPSLAVPGSGDVLSGVIGAFLASGMSAFDAATTGTLAHAAVGAELEMKRGLRGTLAREIADGIPAIIK